MIVVDLTTNSRGTEEPRTKRRWGRIYETSIHEAFRTELLSWQSNQSDFLVQTAIRAKEERELLGTNFNA